MISVSMNVYGKQITEKPKDESVYAELRQQLASGRFIVQIEQLKKIVENYAYTPAQMTGTNSDSWKSQQLICFDVDNAYTDRATKKKVVLDPQLLPDDVVRILSEYNIPVLLMYDTFSCSAENKRFRGMIVCEDVLPDREKARVYTNRIISLLNSSVPGACDTISDAARLFLPGGVGSCFYYQSSNVCALASLENLPLSETEIEEKKFRELDAKRKAERQAREKILPPGSTWQSIQNEIDAQIRNYNLLSTVTLLSGQSKKVARSFRFNPCPICGDNGCFGVSFSGSEWFCFNSDHGSQSKSLFYGWGDWSKNGYKQDGVGGGVLEFIRDRLLYRNGVKMTYSEVRDYFITNETSYDVKELRRLYMEEKEGSEPKG